MAIGKESDLKVYNEEMQGGYYERVAQFVDAMNASSRNAIRLVSRQSRGDYEKDAFFKIVSGMVSRRDMTSVSAATDLAMTQDDFVSVKINRKWGPVTHAIGALKKIGMDSGTFSFKVGQMAAEAVTKDQLNTGIAAIEAAIEGVGTDLNYNGSAGTLTHAKLASGLAKLGDQASRIVCWVMHSKPYFDLIGQAITDKITNVADVVIVNGTVATLGRPVVVTDAPALWDANGSASAGDDTYNVLGLVEGALSLIESETPTVVGEVVTGLEQLCYRMQGEFTYNIGCKGFQWDVTHGGANPTDATIATTTNWDKVVTSVKDCAGVRVTVK